MRGVAFKCKLPLIRLLCRHLLPREKAFFVKLLTLFYLCDRIKSAKQTEYCSLLGVFCFFIGKYTLFGHTIPFFGNIITYLRI